MPTRSQIIRTAYTLPKNSPKRRKLLAALKEGSLQDIQKAAREFDEAYVKLKRAAKKLHKLFKRHPVQGDDWGRGEAAEELVADTLQAMKELDNNPIMLSVYTQDIENMHRGG